MVGPLLNKFLLPAVAFLFFASTVLGAVRNYCPVPFWDMWDGYIGFYELLSRGHWEVWWAPANEHLILFSRVFFWLDLKFFHGLSLLLIPLNIVLMILLWLAMFLGTQRLFKSSPDKNFLVIAGSWLALICFSWMQKENITWAYQAPFFAAALFPLLAFQNLALSSTGPRSRLQFAGALFCGIVSLGTMANGTLALPLMLLLAALLRQSKVRILILAISTVFGFVVSYRGPGTFGSLGSAFIAHPGETLGFFLLYLGGPFRVISNNFLVAEITGFIFVAACAQCASIWYRREKGNPMFLAFVIFLLFIVATALATTSGRAMTGAMNATVSRYLTPVLLGWAVLSILIGYHYREHANYPGAVLIISTLFPLLLLPSQLDSIVGDAPLIKHQRMVAALALSLGVADKEFIQTIYPDDRIYATANVANRLHLSIFGLPAFRNAGRSLHQKATALALRECQSHIDTILSLNGVDGVSRVQGWAFDGTAERVPEEVFFVNSSDIVVGVGLTGLARPDVAKAVNRKASFSGFDGYVFGETKNIEVKLEAPR